MLLSTHQSSYINFHLFDYNSQIYSKKCNEKLIEYFLLSACQSSLTFQLWREYFGYPQKSNLNRKMTDQDMEYMKKQMDKFIRASKGEKVEFEEGEEEQFIVKTSWLSIDDPCFCGSGKVIIECCMTKDQFKNNSENPNKI